MKPVEPVKMTFILLVANADEMDSGSDIEGSGIASHLANLVRSNKTFNWCSQSVVQKTQHRCASQDVTSIVLFLNLQTLIHIPPKVYYTRFGILDRSSRI